MRPEQPVIAPPDDPIVRYGQVISHVLGRKKAAQFRARSALAPKRIGAWLAHVDTSLPAGLPEDLPAYLANKAAGRYLRPWLDASQRIAILKHHYACLGASMTPEGLARLTQDKAGPYLEMTGASGRVYALGVRREYSREGEIDFQFLDGASGAPLCSIRGALGPDGLGRPAFWIGVMQGAKPPIGAGEIAFATKDLNVMRPKQAALHAVAAFAEHFGAACLIAPARDNQVSHRWWRGVLKDRLITSEYDEFWRELTLARDAHGDYVIPLPLPRRRIEDVQPKRRRNWRARYARLDAIAAGTEAFLRALTKPGLPAQE